MITDTPPTLCQSPAPGLQPAFLRSSLFQVSRSASAPSPGHASGVPYPNVRPGLSVFADHTSQRQGKSVALGSPGVQANVVPSTHVIQPFVNLGQSQQFGSIGGQPSDGPQQFGSLGTQLSGGPQQLGSLGGQLTGGPQQFGSIGNQLQGGPQQLGSIGGQLIGGPKLFLNIEAAGAQPFQPQLNVGAGGPGALNVGAEVAQTFHPQLNDGAGAPGALNVGSLGVPPVQPQLDIGAGGPSALNVGAAGAQPLHPQLNVGPLNAEPLQGHHTRPLMMSGLRPPMTPTQMLKFSVKPVITAPC